MDGPVGKSSWLRHAIEGEREALDRLVEEYRPIVWRFARSLDRRAGEEQVNEILVRVVRLLRDPAKEYDDRFGQKFTAWLYAVTRNVLRDEWKGRARAAAVRSLDAPAPAGLGPGWREPVWRGSSPSRMAIRAELRELVQARLQRLPPLYRRVLELHWLKERPVPEIARRLGVSEGTVRKRIQRAQMRLRADLNALRSTLLRFARPG